MKFLKFVTLAALPVLLFIACHTNQENVSAPKGEEQAKSSSVADTALISENVPPQREEGDQGKKGPPQKNNHEAGMDWDKKIIKTAELSLEVKDYNDFNARVHAAVRQFGGYVSQEEQEQSAYQIENKVSIKVPVDQFDDAVSNLSSGSNKIVERKITSEDVTSEVVDTKSRIEAKKEVRLRYLELLKQARNMQDILAVQSEINNIQEQLESAAGRMAYLGHLSAFSTINLTFYQITDATAINEKEPPYLYQIREAFSGGLKWIGELILVLVSLWPLFVAVIGLVIFVRKRKFGKSKAVQA
ncbi:MAG TPA: DUF4349 domain-containing protein [Puia sp.]|nr:DUF4349 domain-containing protein [Puia sp.]